MSELVVILGIALVVFGPGKLPEVGRAIGKSIGEFKKATNLEADSPKHEPEPKQLTEK